MRLRADVASRRGWPWASLRAPAARLLIAVLLAAIALLEVAPAARAEVPVGSIVPVGAAGLPAGWLPADGAAVSRTTYADLFAVIGTTYGAGDGTTTFNVPDLRQRFPIGRGTSLPTIGVTGGTFDHAPTIASHSHGITSAGSHSHAATSPAHSIAHTHSFAGHGHGLGSLSIAGVGDHQHPLPFSAGGSEVDVAGLDGWMWHNAVGLSTSTDGSHTHGWTGQIGATGSGVNGDGAVTSSGSSTGLSATWSGTTSTDAAHAHGGTTGAAAGTTTAANHAFLATTMAIKATAATTTPCGTIWWTAAAASASSALPADGATVSRSTESYLFSCLSTTFGAGDGSTNYALPDLRGRSAIGVGGASGASTLGATGGSLDHTHTVGAHAHAISSEPGGTHTANHQHTMAHTVSLPGHLHGTGTAAVAAGGAHSHAIAMLMGGSQWNNGGNAGYLWHNAWGSTTGNAGAHSHGVSGTIGNTGGSSGDAAITSSAPSAGSTGIEPVTTTTSAAHDHGGATTTTTGSTDTANAPYSTIRTELQRSAATDVAVGTIVAYPASTTPPGWLVADGAAVNRTVYASLFARIGITYGPGNGSTTFNLPDLRDSIPVSRAVAGTASTLGARAGSLSHTHVASHNHGSSSQPDHTHDVPIHDHSMAHTHTVAGHRHGLGTLAVAAVGDHSHSIPLQIGGSRFDAGGTSGYMWHNAWGLMSEPAGAHSHAVTGRFGAAGVDGDATMTSGASSAARTGTVAATTASPAGAHSHAINTAAPSTAAASTAPYGVVSFLIRASDPTVVSASPPTVAQGRRGIVIRFTGTDFQTGATVSVSGGGVTASSPSVVSATTIDATIDVAGAAALGARTVTVTNPDGSTGSGAVLTIVAPSISMTMSTLGYADAGRDSTAPLALDFGTILPGIVREIGPASSGQAFAGPAIQLDWTSDTDI
ncbi:MAG: putative tail fiber protein, partial [Thermoleophilia bacterium]|nr:putative tail fiber protein [Thermoleophilia bacterium]